MRYADRYGISAAQPSVDLKTVMGRVRSVIEAVYQPESPHALRARGVDVYLDEAHFVDSHTISVGNATLTAKRVIIATGAQPLIPLINGLDSLDYLTYETIWGLEALTRRLLVVGGGPVGCELAQAFCRLGSTVTLLEIGPRVIPHDEPEASDVVAQALVEEGVDLHVNARAERAWKNGNEIHLDTNGQELAGDTLLLAVGRRPTTDGLGLENAGVA
jgi:pyruvate/2-oxoglutarate dehydrogenase complex dihydrolipoamide dehydrogenase (E3) component